MGGVPFQWQIMIGLGTTRLAVSQAARHPMARQAHAELRLDRGMSWERAKGEGEGGAGNAGSRGSPPKSAKFGDSAEF